MSPIDPPELVPPPDPYPGAYPTAESGEPIPEEEEGRELVPVHGYIESGRSDEPVQLGGEVLAGWACMTLPGSDELEGKTGGAKRDLPEGEGEGGSDGAVGAGGSAKSAVELMSPVLDKPKSVS